MRRTAVLIPLAGLLLAGCGGGDDGPTVLSVTTPGPSATAGAASPTAVATSTATSLPPPKEATTTAAPTGPASAYQGLVLDWQRARAVFFTAISDGRQRSVAQQRGLAATYLKAQQAFATGLGRTGWPAGARASVRALVAVNREQQATLAAMATAGTSGAFTASLGRYGVLAGRENAAVTAVARALG